MAQPRHILEPRQIVNYIHVVPSCAVCTAQPPGLLVGLRHGRLGHIMELIANSLKELT